LEQWLARAKRAEYQVIVFYFVDADILIVIVVVVAQN